MIVRFFYLNENNRMKHNITRHASQWLLFDCLWNAGGGSYLSRYHRIPQSPWPDLIFYLRSCIYIPHFLPIRSSAISLSSSAHLKYKTSRLHLLWKTFILHLTSSLPEVKKYMGMIMYMYVHYSCSHLFCIRLLIYSKAEATAAHKYRQPGD